MDDVGEERRVLNVQLFLSVGRVTECLNLRKLEGWTEMKKTWVFGPKVLTSLCRRESWKICRYRYVMCESSMEGMEYGALHSKPAEQFCG